MTKIKLIVGSIRERRFAEKALPWVLESFEKYKGDKDLQIEVLDLKDWNFPIFAEPVSPMFIKNEEYRLDIVRSWSQKIKDAEAFIFLTPEYNHGVSSVVKNAMDYLFSEWQYKPFGIVGYGEVGGANMIQMLRLIGIELRMIPVKQAVHIMNPWELKDKDGNLITGSLDKYYPQFETMMSDILFLARKLK